MGLARLRGQEGRPTRPLAVGWRCLSVPSGSAARPEELPSDAAWLAAPVPGTVAEARRAAGLAVDPSADLHAEDHWYRLAGELSPGGRLEFAGLATLAEIWLDG